MKKFLILFASLVLFAACNRGTCPAYMNGASTGASGSSDKKQDLFPKEMRKKK